jgi:hypothetical protein
MQEKAWLSSTSLLLYFNVRLYTYIGLASLLRAYA